MSERKVIAKPWLNLKTKEEEPKKEEEEPKKEEEKPQKLEPLHLDHEMITALSLRTPAPPKVATARYLILCYMFSMEPQMDLEKVEEVNGVLKYRGSPEKLEEAQKQLRSLGPMVEQVVNLLYVSENITLGIAAKLPLTLKVEKTL
jgi:hypothetical protein